MLRSLRATGRILAVAWPELLAWYLGGQVVRAAVLAVAVPIGPESPLAALLIVPIAALAGLISYVGMFLSARKAMINYRAVSAGDVEFASFRDAAREFSTILLASVIPFFTLYALIGLLAADLSEYARGAFRQSLGSENGVLNVGDGPLVVTVIVLALSGRLTLKVLGSRIPRGFAILEIYLEATWIFVALTGLYGAFGDALRWIEARAVVVWVADAKEYLVSIADPIRLFFVGIDWAIPVLVNVVLLPLAWLLVAGVIYTRTLANVDDDKVAPRAEARASQLVKRGYSILPAALKRQAFLVTDEWDDVGSPLSQAARLVAKAGALGLACYVAAHAALFAAGQWLSYGLYRAVGPHESSFWITLDPLLSLVDNIITEPLRIVVIAVAFDWCLGQWRARRETAATPAEIEEPALAP